MIMIGLYLCRSYITPLDHLPFPKSTPFFLILAELVNRRGGELFQHFQELQVLRNEDDLEIPLHHAGQLTAQPANVILRKPLTRLVQHDDAGWRGAYFSQGETEQYGGQALLLTRATSSHLHLLSSLLHHQAVPLQLLVFFVVSLDPYIGNVSSKIYLTPMIFKVPVHYCNLVPPKGYLARVNRVGVGFEVSGDAIQDADVEALIYVFCMDGDMHFLDSQVHFKINFMDDGILLGDHLLAFIELLFETHQSIIYFPQLLQRSIIIFLHLGDLRVCYCAGTILILHFSHIDLHFLNILADLLLARIIHHNLLLNRLRHVDGGEIRELILHFFDLFHYLFSIPEGLQLFPIIIVVQSFQVFQTLLSITGLLPFLSRFLPIQLRNPAISRSGQKLFENVCQRSSTLKWPKTIFFVAKKHVICCRARDSHQSHDLLIHLSPLILLLHCLPIHFPTDRLPNRLKLPSFGPQSERYLPSGCRWLATSEAESKLSLPNYFCLFQDGGVRDEVPSLVTHRRECPNHQKSYDLNESLDDEQKYSFA